MKIETTSQKQKVAFKLHLVHKATFPLNLFSCRHLSCVVFLHRATLWNSQSSGLICLKHALRFLPSFARPPLLSLLPSSFLFLLNTLHLWPFDSSSTRRCTSWLRSSSRMGSQSAPRARTASACSRETWCARRSRWIPRILRAPRSSNCPCSNNTSRCVCECVCSYPCLPIK